MVEAVAERPRRAWAEAPDGSLKTLPDTIRRVHTMIGDAVLIELLPPPEKSAGGIWIPEVAQQNREGYVGALHGRIRKGIVKAVGPGRRDIHGKLRRPEVRAGDRITFYYAAEYDWLVWPDKDHVIFPERYIQTVLEGDETMIRPLHDRILVRRMAQTELVRGGMFIPDIAQEKPLEGDVVAVGTGKRLDSGEVTPLDVKPGDRVLFGKYSGTEIVVNGEPLMIIREEELLAILSPVEVAVA